ncbi:MAG: hypothetical protein M3R70_04580 [Actinomycetota bacterium]|nr:hypothetical protein [Actinomycetota bacterium]
MYAATRFLYTGADPTQKGVAAGTIDPERVAVLRGRVLDGSGKGLPSVTLTVTDHPEFGYTVSRVDGRFDLVVNGGAPLTANYDRPAYMSLQRTQEVPWQTYVDVEDVVMKPYDAKVTTIAENSPGLQVATGNSVTDGDGTRQTTLMFKNGTDATMTLPDGTKQPLGDLKVRSTEYTVGAAGDEAMPGELPASSAYTYATEFSVDQAVQAKATDVTFDKPVATYVDNFLGFPAGTLVPAAYYDEAKQAWVASGNGVVLRILKITGGVEIDVTGDGAADTGAALDKWGITAAELQQLGSRYAIGKTLWRVAVKHFTPWDYNWPYGCKQDCPPPKEPPPPPPPCRECQGKGSIIGFLNQTLGEMLPIVGTPFRLQYSSDRSPGFKEAYTVRVPLTGAAPTGNLSRVDLQITVAGREFTKSFTSAPNLSYAFTWDGKDAYGRVVEGAQMAHVRVGYVYPAVYLKPDEFANSFGQYGGSPVTGDRTRQQITVWQEWDRAVGVLGPGSDALGGWTLNVHHSYDPQAKILYLGDGTRRTTDAVRSQIGTVAGTGFPDHSGEPTIARDTSIGYSRGVAAAPDGGFYIADTDNNVIRRVTRDGKIATVAGGGSPDDGIGDGLPATQAQLVSPSDVAVADDGTLYISDTGNARIRRVDPKGKISTIAGGGDPTALGDGGPATDASLSRPRGVALTKDATVFVADTGHDRVRRITPDGMIATAAGGGAPSDGLGDGGSGRRAALDHPYDVAVDSQGVLYVADGLHHRIRAVRSDGQISTVAGNGLPGSNGNGGRAKDAEIGEPQGLSASADGTIYFADRLHHVIRKITPDGYVAGAAGTGASGYDGEQGPPLQAQLSFPQDVSVAKDGSIFIADAANYRIRQSKVGLPGFTDADISIPSEDGSELYLFNTNGRHLRTIDAVTGVAIYRFAYDSIGRLASITDRDGNVTQVSRAASGAPTSLVAPGGQTTTLGLGSDGLLASVANPAGNTTRLTYAAGLLATATEPEGGVHRYAYDSFGRLVRDQNADGEVQTLTRADLPGGVSVRVQTGLGRQTQFTFEQLPTGDFRRTSKTPSGAVTTTLAGESGRITTMDPDGTVSTLTLAGDPRWGMLAPRLASEDVKTPAGLEQRMTSTRMVVLTSPDDLLSVESITDTWTFTGERTASYKSTTTAPATPGSSWTVVNETPEGRRTTVTLDARGHVSRRKLDAATTGGTAEAIHTYDTKGRITSVVQGDQRLNLVYDAKNRVVSETDATGAQSTFAYDLADRLTEKRLPGGQIYGYAYEANGNIRTVTMPKATMPNEYVHTFGWTPGSKLKTYTPPATGASYDSAFDADGRQSALTSPSGGAERYTYDTGGRLTALVRPDSRDAFAYNATGPTDRMTRMTRTAGSTVQTEAATYDGFLLTGLDMTGAAAGSFSYAYDKDFLPKTLKLTTGSTTTEMSLAFDRDNLLTKYGSFSFARSGPAGRVSKVTTSGASVDYAYDTLARLTSRTHTVGSAQAYKLQLGYDAGGRTVQRTETIGGTPKTLSYTYDSNSRLVQVKQGATILESYSYDANGNRLSGPTGAATYDAQDRLISLGGVAYQWNADGFLTGRGTSSFHYDMEGALRSATVGGTVVSYAYDSRGRRVRRIDSSGTWQYLYGSSAPFRLTAARSPSGKLQLYYYDSDGALFALDSGGTRYYVGSDQVGSPRVVTDATGAVVKRVDYDSYGRVTQDTNPSFELPIGFAGGLADPVTGLVRFGLRDYDPAAGRWTAKDPLLFDGSSTNLYAYVGDDPIGLNDPTGLFGWDDVKSAWDTVTGAKETVDTAKDWADTAKKTMEGDLDGLKDKAADKLKPDGAIEEYKKTREEVAGEKSQESTWDFSKKVKCIWNTCTKAIGGDADPSCAEPDEKKNPQKTNDKRPPQAKKMDTFKWTPPAY